MSRPIVDKTGQRNGILTALAFVGRTPAGRALWRCRCDCGRECTVPSNELRRQRSCGCERPGQRAQCEGMRAGAWTVLRVVPGPGARGRRRKWHAVCACGAERVLETGEWLYRWSCGCIPPPKSVRAAKALRNRAYYAGHVEERRVASLAYYERRKRNRKAVDESFADRGSQTLRDHWERVLSEKGMPRELFTYKRELPVEPAILDDPYNSLRLQGQEADRHVKFRGIARELKRG